jgi:hypothetical protein
MLPTYPQIVGLRREANVAAIKTLVKQMAPAIGMIGHNVQFEGRAHTMARADASISEVDMAPVSAEIRVAQGSRLSEFTREVLQAHLIGVARQMAQGMSDHFFEVIDRGTQEAGMVVDAKGQPLTEDLFLDLIEKMEHTFNEDGSWNPPTMVMAPEMAERLKGAQTSEAAQKRLSEILERKRDEFLRRQAGRILAG